MSKITAAFQCTVIVIAFCMASVFFLPQLSILSASPFAMMTAPVPAVVSQPTMRVGGRQIVRLDVEDMEPGSYAYIIVKHDDETVEFIEDTSQQIKLSPGSPPTDDGPGPETVIDVVRQDFKEAGKLDVFNQQRGLLLEVMIIPNSSDDFNSAYNHVNGIIQSTLKNYATREGGGYWDAWLIPFSEAMEEEKAGDRRLDVLEDLVDEARSELEGN